MCLLLIVGQALLECVCMWGMGVRESLKEKMTFDFKFKGQAGFFQSEQERDRKGSLKQRFYGIKIMKVLNA